MDTLAYVLSATLVPLFFVGMIGSVAVVVVTVIRDLGQVLTSDEADDSADL
jgi:hypothetical protein